MALDPYMKKAVLDWMLGGAAVTRPIGHFINYATGTPNADGASNGPITSRKSILFAVAASPTGSATHSAAVSGGTCSAIATVQGWNIYDAAVNGNRLLYGTCNQLGCASGDVIRMAAGSCKIILS